MTVLDVDFSEGDILTAGLTTSTSSVNGITTQINSNTATIDNHTTAIAGKLIYVGSSTVSTVGNYASETNIGEVLIPANTVTTGIIATASIAVEGAQPSVFKLKIGPTDSEVTKQEYEMIASGTSGQILSGSLLFYDSTQTWTSDVTVIVTGNNNAAAPDNISTCYQIVVTGY